MGLFEIPAYNTKTGTMRAYQLAAIVFVSSFLSGYDAGVAGGVLTFKPFMKDFHYTTPQKTKINSLTVGLGQLGSFVSCMAFYPLATRFGRKYCIMGSAVLFCLGAAIQTANSHSLAAWYVGRVVAGMGQGGLSVCVPMYCAEAVPREIRGRCGSFYQWMYTWGILISYWIDYAVALRLVGKSAEWQIPIGLQLVSSGILFFGTFYLPESPRWLLTQHREEEAWKALSWVRADTGDKTIAEFNEMKQGLQAEKLATAELSFKEVMTPQNRMRFFLGASLFTFQNSTGSSALAVFGPQFFTLLVGSNSGNTSLLLTGLFGAVKVIACTFFIFFIAERFGRRTLLMSGALIMAACMLTVGLVDHFKAPPHKGVVTSAGKATVALIYLDIMVYNCSWGPLPWAYVPEVFPTRIRSLGMGTSMLAHWLTSFVFSFASPYMIANIGWATFLIFAGLDVVAAVFCWFFVRETRGKGLENATGVQWEIAEKEVGSGSDDGRYAGTGEGGEKGQMEERVKEKDGEEVIITSAKMVW